MSILRERNYQQQRNCRDASPFHKTSFDCVSGAKELNFRLPIT
jgi:hypothetical protein